MTDTQDDYTHDRTTTGAVSIGVSAKGAFESNFDTDWFKTPLQAGTTYLFSLTGLTQGGGSLYGRMDNISLAVMDESGQPLIRATGKTSAGMDFGPAAEFTPAVSGNYFLSAQHYDGTGGSYTMTATVKPAGDDLPAGTGTTKILEAGGTAQGVFEVAGDRDWFKFHAEKGQHYAFGTRNITGEVTTWSMQLYDAGGKPIAIPVYPFEPLETGDFYVEMASVEAGPYTVFSRILEDDYSSNVATTGILQPGIQASGKLQYRYDSDYFKVSMKAGVQYAFELTAAPGDIAYLTFDLRDASGQHLPGYARNVNGSVTQTITATATAEYFVDVSAENLPTGSARGAYALKVTDTPGSGNDLLKSDGKGSAIDAGAGTDTIEYSLAAAQYQVARKDGQVTVQASGATAGDILTGVERLKFADTSMAFDIDGVAGQAYRLYQAAFNRSPDKGGVGYWLGQMDKGVSLHDVSRSFMDSAEFQALYGTNLSDAAFVNQLYQNVLHRPAEQAGVDYWIGTLQSGQPRADVLSSFSEGGENKAALVGVIGDGFHYTLYP